MELRRYAPRKGVTALRAKEIGLVNLLLKTDRVNSKGQTTA